MNKHIFLVCMNETGKESNKTFKRRKTPTQIEYTTHSGRKRGE